MRLRQRSELGDGLARRDRWSLDLDFARATQRVGKARSARFKGLPGVTYTGGAGFKYSLTAGGVYVRAAANDPGETDAGLGIWEARTNSIRNPTGLGAVPGSPGTTPTNWTIPAVNGVSPEVVSTGEMGGLPYVDVRYFGTATAAGNLSPRFEALSQIAASTGQTWTGECSFALVGGSFAGVSTAALRIAQYSGALAYLAEASGAVPSLLGIGPALQRFRVSGTANHASVAFVVPYWQFTYNLGAVIDLTIRIAAPNLKLGVDIGDPPILQTSNLAATRTAELPRVDYQPPAAGWLFAEFVIPQTLSASNSRVIGAHGSSISPLNLHSSATRLEAFNGAQVLQHAIPLVAGSLMRAVTTWDGSGRSIVANGQPPSSDANPVGDLSSGLALGYQGAGATFLNSLIRFVRAGGRRLTAAEMQAMTAL